MVRPCYFSNAKLTVATKTLVACVICVGHSTPHMAVVLFVMASSPHMHKQGLQIKNYLFLKPHICYAAVQPSRN